MSPIPTPALKKYKQAANYQGSPVYPLLTQFMSSTNITDTYYVLEIASHVGYCLFTTVVPSPEFQTHMQIGYWAYSYCFLYSRISQFNNSRL